MGIIFTSTYSTVYITQILKIDRDEEKFNSIKIVTINHLLDSAGFQIEPLQFPVVRVSEVDRVGRVASRDAPNQQRLRVARVADRVVSEAVGLQQLRRELD